MASESVGNAYLNVIPKIEGDAKSLGSKFGSQLSGGASSALSAGTVALGNILANVAQTAASAIADQFQQAFQNAMDYEQLAGGAQKIFDEVDYSVIAKDAQNAFRDLNMSANEYIASINLAGAAFAQTMGDEKGYAVAREGMLAISDYATGTGRNIDELNQKYQMITRSTSSYQSIADQFAGILPATSKDFLEQAQAAGYLSDEYKQLTEVPVAEYQEAVTKMLTKGVDDLGLAANTLHESETTMSGSLAMLGSSWQNFLTALAGGEGLDIKQITNDLVNSFVAAAQNIIPTIGQIIASVFLMIPGMQEVVDWVEANIVPIIVPALQQVADFVTNTVVPAVQKAIAVIEPAVQGFIDMLLPLLLNVVDFLSSTVIPVVLEVATFVINTVQEIYTAISPIIDGIVQFVSGAFETISGIVTTIMGVIKGIVTGDWQMASDGVNSILSGLQGIIGGIWNTITGIISTAMNAISSVISSIWDAISSTVSSIVGGIASTIGGIFDGIVSTIQGAMDTIKGIIDDIIGLFTGLGDRISSAIGSIHFPTPNIDYKTVSLPGGATEELPLVTWYARGGIINGAHLIGVGEAGPEMILPKRGGLMAEFAEAVTEKVNAKAGMTQNFQVYANDPMLVAAVVASKQRRAYA